MTTLGIDLGTGSVKAARVSAEGTVERKARHPYPVTAPHPGWAESDPLAWLSAAREVATQALADAPGPVEAVGFSGQMHGVVVTDAALTPLRPAILWADGRSSGQALALAHDLSAEDLSRLGSPAVPGFAATTLAWLYENEPALMARAVHVLQPKDWLRASLGGGLATDPSDASGTLLYDVVSGGWSERAGTWVGLPSTLLPSIAASTAHVGEVSFGAGPLACVVGGADTACALAGLGIGPEEGFLAVGSGAQVVRRMTSPKLDASLRTHTFAIAGVAGQGWYRIGAVQSAGLSLTAALAWFGASVEEASAALAEGVRADDPVFVPYLSGERTPFMDPGMRGSWLGLSLATDRASMLRSILEGVAQAVALGVSAVQDSGEPMPEVVPLVGGGTNDASFRQLLADATGLSLAVTDAPDAAVVGAALLAAGLTSNPNPAGHREVVTPEPEAMALLAERRGRMVASAITREEP